MVSPDGVTTVIGPVRAFGGTKVVIVLAAMTENLLTFAPVNLTAVAPAKFVPKIVTGVPGCPRAGEKPVIVGSAIVDTVKLLAPVATPLGVLIETP